MNTTLRFKSLGGGLASAAVASLLAACASTAVRPTGAADARARLTQLESDPALANRAPAAMHEAEAAVRVAEQPGADSDLEAYRVYIADRKVDTARAEAETRLAKDQRPALRAQSEQARLDSRTRELGVAQDQTAAADAAGAEQASAANAARNAASAADLAAGNAQQQAADARSEAAGADSAAASSGQKAARLQRQLDLLQARSAGPGLVVTLQDPVFSDDGAVSEDSSSAKLNRVVAFLERFPDRTATIEGFSDDTGTGESEQAGSQRRADSVMSYLIRRGIAPGRLMALGMGDSSPVATNDTASGRQRNRRIEVTIQAAAGPMLR
jgi:outer membrane protein OmpA-like peptidoglycan-associated protein